MRFVRQRNGYTCVPIALINLDKYLGGNSTLKDLSKVCEEVGCRPRLGTFMDEETPFSDYLESRYETEYLHKANKREVAYYLSRGYPIIVGQEDFEGDDHAFLLLPNWMAINFSHNHRTKEHISWGEVKGKADLEIWIIKERARI